MHVCLKASEPRTASHNRNNLLDLVDPPSGEGGQSSRPTSHVCGSTSDLGHKSPEPPSLFAHSGQFIGPFWPTLLPIRANSFAHSGQLICPFGPIPLPIWANSLGHSVLLICPFGPIHWAIRSYSFVHSGQLIGPPWPVLKGPWAGISLAHRPT